MLEKEFEYTDYNGVVRKEKHYFNFSESEMTEMQLMKVGGFAEYLQSIIDAKDQTVLVTVFKDLILKAYGVKSEDGRRFIKSPATSEEFAQTEAYSQLYMSLVSSEQAALDFFRGVIPPSMQGDGDKAVAVSRQNIAPMA